MTITEDTPEGGPEELQWKINALTDVHERVKDELKRESHAHNATLQKLHEAQDRYDTLTSRLTVGVLRKAGYTVTIEEAEFCEACGEEY
jgi:recombinational DNA repair protein (RecF pathway)